SAGNRHVRSVSAAAEIAAFFVFDRHAAEERRVVLPCRDVEETGSGTERRRVPVRAALISRPGWLPRRLRRLDRPSPLVEMAYPVHFHERLSDQELAGLAFEHVEVAVP